MYDFACCDSPVSAPSPGPQLFSVSGRCVIHKLHCSASPLSTVLGQSLNVQLHLTLLIPKLHLLHT